MAHPSGVPTACDGVPSTAGVRRLPVRTPQGTFEVWTRRSGDNRRIKLLLHGGPGYTHEYFEVFDAVLPQAGIELHDYDQLCSDCSSLWSSRSLGDRLVYR